MSLPSFFGLRRSRTPPADGRVIQWLRPFLFVFFFLSSLVVAVPLHLNLAVSKRILSRTLTQYLDRELTGHIDLGRIERLDADTVWLSGLSVYDAEARRVIAVDHLRAKTSTFRALWDLFTSNDKLTVHVDSVWAEGVTLRLLPSAAQALPSLVQAFELAPNRDKAASTLPSRPFRVALTDVRLNEVLVDNQLTSLPVTQARFKQLAGLVLITPEGAAVSLKQFGLNLVGVHQTELSGTTSLEFRSPDHLWGQFNATLGPVPFSGSVDYRAERLDLRLDAPKIAPEQAKRVYPAWPLKQTAALSVDAHGPLSALGTRLTMTVERGTLDLFGTTNLSANPSAELGLTGTHLDLSALFGTAFSSDLNLRARGSARLVDDKLQLRFDGLVDSGTLLGEKTPVVDFEGQKNAEGLILSVRSRDPQMPLRAGLWMRDEQLELDAQLSRVSLAPLLLPFGLRSISGIATVRARGKLSTERLEVDADATIEQAQYGKATASALTIKTSFAGPMAHPKLWQGRVAFNAKQLKSPYFEFPALQLQMQGTPERLTVQATGTNKHDWHIDLATQLFPQKEQTVELTDTTASLARGAHHLDLRIARAVLGGAVVDVRGLAVTGSVGDLKGDLSWRTQGASANVDVQRFDLGLLNDLLGLPSHQLAGNVTAKLALEASDFEHAKGTAQVSFDGITIGWLTQLSGRWDHTLADRELRGHLRATSALIEGLAGDYTLDLAGPITQLSSFYDATGQAEFALDRLLLDQLAPLLRLSPARVATTGTISSRLTLTRTQADTMPNLVLSVASDGLGLHVAESSDRSVTLEQASLLGNVAYEGATALLTTDWVLSQNQRPRALLGFATTVDLRAFFTDPATAAGGLYDLPFDAWLRFPKQSLGEFEPIFGTPLGTGQVEGKLWLKGPLTDPHLVVDISGQQLTLVALGNSAPIDAQSLIEFAHRNGETRILCAIGSTGRPWATLNAIGNVFANDHETRLARNLHPLNWNYDWSGKIELGLTNLPLGSLPFAADSGVDGTVRGGATITRSQGVTHIDALVPIDNLQIRSRPFGQSLVSMRSDGDSLELTAKLIDGGALIDMGAIVPIVLSTPLPSPNPTEPLRLSAHATGYDAGILAPFLEDYLGKLQGEMSGDVEASLVLGDKDTEAQLAVGGTVQLRGGSARLKTFGLDVSDVQLNATANSTGSRTLIHVPMVAGAVGTNQQNLEGTMVIELDRLKLRRLGASISRMTDLPLLVNGVTLANLTGSAQLELLPTPATASRPAGGYELDIGVRELEIKLPRQQTREVVALSENPDIEVLQPLSQAAYQRTKQAISAPITLKLDLGRKTRVTRNDFNLPISGQPSMTFTDALHPSGNVELEPGGRLQLMGKTFVIERGRVTLAPADATNPHFDVVAQWRGPTHVVTATVTGTPEEATLRLASDPALPSEAEVLTMLMSGSGAEVNTTTAGIGVGASLFKEFVSETPLSSLELRTSQDAQHANYSAAVPLKDNLWFEGTYKNATSGSAGPNGTTNREGFSGTVDWRFRKNWSLRTEVGTLGAGADLLWQYRY